MSTIAERDLVALLQVFDGADNIALPFSIRARLVERNAMDICTGIAHCADDLLGDCTKFAQTVLPLKLQDASFDMFSATFTSVLAEELEKADDEPEEFHQWVPAGEKRIGEESVTAKEKYKPDWEAGRLIYKACSNHIAIATLLIVVAAAFGFEARPVILQYHLH